MTEQGMGQFIDNLKQKLKLKILSIYVVEDEKKQEIIDLIYKTENVDLLYEVEKKLDSILEQVGDLTVYLLDKSDKSMLMDFKMLLQREIIDRILFQEQEDEMELNELDDHFNKILENI